MITILKKYIYHYFLINITSCRLTSFTSPTVFPFEPLLTVGTA